MIEPLLVAAPPQTGASSGRRRLGRPPPDLRPVLDAILWKISTCQPWYSLPDDAGRIQAAGCNLAAPSWQTCYRYYRKWQRSGLLDQVYRLLFQDLVQRGALDLPAALASGAVSFELGLGRWSLHFDPSWQDTWPPTACPVRCAADLACSPV